MTDQCSECRKASGAISIFFPIILVIYGLITLIIFAGIWAVLWAISFSIGLDTPAWTLATGVLAAIPVIYGLLSKGGTDD
jgi:hypothetical protein